MFRATFGDYCTPRLKNYILAISVIFLYLTLGALLFSNLEDTNENERWDKIVEFHKNISLSKSLSINDFETLVNLNIKPFEIDYLKNNHTNYKLWDFYGSLFFSLVLVSTIGYGNQVPLTTEGQLACVLYAFVGIPVFLTSLQKWTLHMKSILKDFENRLPINLKKHHSILLQFSVGVLFLTIFVLPAIFIAFRENWTYKTSFYFSFITLSTIGFGDYVPTNQLGQPKHYKIFIVIWMMIGLAYVALLIAWFQVLIEKWFNYIEKKKIRQSKSSTIFVSH